MKWFFDPFYYDDNDRSHDCGGVHLVTTHIPNMDIDWDSCPSDPDFNPDYCKDRSMLCLKTKVVPIEAIVRGHLTGSGWKEYQEKGTLAGKQMPPGIQLSAKIEDVFTPSTKAETGHDVNISIRDMETLLFQELFTSDMSHHIAEKSLALYKQAYKAGFFEIAINVCRRTLSAETSASRA